MIGTEVWCHAVGEAIANGDLEKEFMDSLSDEQKEYYFPAGIGDTVAIELKYFADAIRSGGKPEVDAVEGMRSEAICMAVYESGFFGRPVTIAEIENCELEGYQKEINDKIRNWSIECFRAVYSADSGMNELPAYTRRRFLSLVDTEIRPYHIRIINTAWSRR